MASIQRPLSKFRPLRVLRVVYVVENSRDLRSNFVYFAKMSPQVGAICVLLLLVIVMYSLAAVLFFHHIGVSKYGDFHHVMIRFFVLLTTVNFPNIMLEGLRFH